MDDTIIPETSSIKVLGFNIDTLLTWESWICPILKYDNILIQELLPPLSDLQSQTE